MRTVNLSTIQYSAGQMPNIKEPELYRYLVNEFGKLEFTIKGLVDGHLDQTNVAPTKPRSGDIRYADGTNWNPGSGQGLYWYSGTSWSWYAGGKTNSATIGAVTINNTVGRCNVAAGVASVVVTNNLVSATSNVIASIAQNDVTAVLKNVVAASGSFTINLTAAATANTAINFVVFN